MRGGCGDEGPERCLFQEKLVTCPSVKTLHFFLQNWATVRSKEIYLKKQQCPHNAIVESAKDM